MRSAAYSVQPLPVAPTPRSDEAIARHGPEGAAVAEITAGNTIRTTQYGIYIGSPLARARRSQPQRGPV
jgi:hypothetical protein